MTELIDFLDNQGERKDREKLSSKFPTRSCGWIQKEETGKELRVWDVCTPLGRNRYLAWSWI